MTNSFNPANNRITVSWAPNPEPDASYIVQEKVGDGKWSAGGAVPGNATSYERAIEQPGQYQYRVGAVRAAPTSDSGNGASATKKSEYVATSAVDIAQVTPPTTAGSNGADGSVDGGDPGVFLPTDPTAPAAPVRPELRPEGHLGLGPLRRPVASGPRPSGSVEPARPESTALRRDRGRGPRRRVLHDARLRPGRRRRDDRRARRGRRTAEHDARRSPCPGPATPGRC